MRKLAIFVVSLPLLALAVAWVPLGVAFTVAASPICLMMSLVMLLRGEGPMWKILLEPPLFMLSIYAQTTGLIPDPLDRRKTPR